MTNKRKHFLERMVRINFKVFNQIIYLKYVGIELLEKITKLMINRVQLFVNCRRTNVEKFIKCS